MPKKSCFRGPFHKWHGKRAETLLKSERQHLYHIYLSLWTQCSRKNSLLEIWRILGLFVKPLSANDKYSLINRGSLLQHFQMKLSQKRKTLSQFFLAFSKFWINFQHFHQKMNLTADVFFNLSTPKNVIREMSKKSRFRGTFKKWHGKRVETKLKYEQQQLYHIHWSLWR